MISGSATVCAGCGVLSVRTRLRLVGQLPTQDGDESDAAGEAGLPAEEGEASRR